MKIRLNPTVMSFFGAGVIRLVGMTLRIEWRGLEHLEEARRMSEQVIFSFWHGRLFILSWAHRNRNIQTLVSEHYDGDLLGRIVSWLGFGNVKGSSTRGGAKALRALTAVLKNGLDIGLAVDGPRGPLGHVQQGAIELGRMGSAAVIPVSCTARRRVLFESWDRFQVPVPFSRVIVAYEKPFIVPGSAGPDDREKQRMQLEHALGDLTRKLDLEMGFTGNKVWPHEGD